MADLSVSQIERLGARLRQEVTASDLALLRELRDSYRPALDAVVAEVHAILEFAGIPPTVATRPAKTTRSIIAKLHRERTNLARMQDIAGCRVVVPLLENQEVLLAALADRHPDWRVDDRRQRPSHGYRAVHLITPRPRPVEIQVRTIVQQVWAAISEALDRRHEGIKYGQGPADLIEELQKYSANLARWEASGGVTRELVGDRAGFVRAITAMLDLP